MNLKGLVDEDFINYKKPSMFLIFPTCNWKCEKEFGEKICQNSDIAKLENISIPIEDIVKRYLDNPITRAIVCGGLEPFDNILDIIKLILRLRLESDDEIVIYTGYTEEELEEGNFGYSVKALQKRMYRILLEQRNIIIKYGRYLPNREEKFDEILGVNLSSDNQYAKQF